MAEIIQEHLKNQNVINLEDDQSDENAEEAMQSYVNENINLREAGPGRLVFRRMPFRMWIVGGVIVLLGLYLIYHLALGTWGVLFKGYQEGHWWQYLIALIIIMLGFSFICAGKVESVVLDKHRNVLELQKTNPICLTKRRGHSLSQVHNIRAFKKGHDGVNFYTLHYIIQAEFRASPPVRILES